MYSPPSPYSSLYTHHLDHFSSLTPPISTHQYPHTNIFTSFFFPHFLPSPPFFRPQPLQSFFPVTIVFPLHPSFFILLIFHHNKTCLRAVLLVFLDHTHHMSIYMTFFFLMIPLSLSLSFHPTSTTPHPHQGPQN